VDEAFSACAFLLLKRTLIEAHEGVFFELAAFWAQFVVGSMMVFAVDFYHVSYGLFFSFHPFMVRVGWLGLHVDQFLLNKKCFLQISVNPYILGFYEKCAP